MMLLQGFLLFFFKEEIMKILIMTVLMAATSSMVYARPNRSYTYSQPTKVYSYANNTSNIGNDQDRCQAEADYMAANKISGHVWGCIGSFEGVGYGNSPNCNTCTPSSNMRLTGDASAQDNNGRWYRVRSWR
jgi:hypothetical protein